MAAHLTQEQPTVTRKPAGQRPTNLLLPKSEAHLIARIKIVREFVSDFCKEESKLEGTEVTPTWLIGRLIAFESYNTTKDDGTFTSKANRDRAAVGMQLWNNEEVCSLEKVDLDEATTCRESSRSP